ncbi:MAG: ABC transporter permease [Candidatus Lustribacter sp.]
MTLRSVVEVAWQALERNLSRSLLTMLGVIIGVSAVITTVAIGAGAQVSVQRQIANLGSNLLVVLPGAVTTSGARSGTGAVSSLIPEDGLALVGLDGVDAVTPMVMVRSQVVGGGTNWNTVIQGVAPTYSHVRNWDLSSGTFFSESDMDTTTKVCILGTTVVNNLFPGQVSPIGQSVLIQNVPFTVIGVLQSRGQTGFGQDQDDVVLVPYTSAMKRLTGQTYVNNLMISAKDGANLDQVQAAVTALLRQRHRIVPPEPDDFSVRNMQDIANAAAATASVMQLLLIGVAAVSLVVGGIGIMNIMLVSVTERTREIGLRMAVGARSRAILEQFLVEAMVLSTGGGLIGVVLGTAITLIIAILANWPMIVSPMAILGSVVFSALVGVFFGYYPALKASRLNPIDALRFE